MAVKKSDLYGSIWKSCDELRGSMDASQYKDYVLALLFVKYVSDKYSGQRYPPIIVPKGGSFADMREAKNKPNIGELLNTIIKKLAHENKLSEVIDTADFDDKSMLGDGSEQIERLTNLISIFEDPALDFSKNRASDDDLLGDAYEYLMRNFATQSGKSKGQFYTPAEVSRVIAKIIGIQYATSSEQTLYDPTCGSGSLLLKAADEAPVDITIYGQENDTSTRALAKMNMILHDNTTARIEQGNTLSNPKFKENGRLQTFDFVVANPPFSSKAWSNGIKPSEDEFDRFIYGIPPSKNGDYAFFQHVLKSLKSKGKGAIILPHGVLFRGNAEEKIREQIIRHGYIKGIISLPANLFYGTSIAACIIVIDKENAEARRGIFMIDASKGFLKDGNKNRLRHQDIHKIIDVFNNQITLPRYSRMVSFEEIEKNEYNLYTSRYIDNMELDDIQDIEAHLLGGIPSRDIEALSPYWKVFPSVAQELFNPNRRKGYYNLKVNSTMIKAIIFQHPEFKQYSESVNIVYNNWVQQNMPHLKNIHQGDLPKDLIERIAEDLLIRFANVALIDKYDIYQNLMIYWTEVMQDDVYILSADGWQVAKSLRILVKKEVKKEKKYIEPHDFELDKKRYKADMIPPELVIRRYFNDQQTEIEGIEAKIATTTLLMQELKDEYNNEDGLLAEVKDTEGNITKVMLNARIKVIQDNKDEVEEYTILIQYRDLLDTEEKLKDLIKNAKGKLYRAVISKYSTLAEDEIKILIVEDKWLTTIEARVNSELERIPQVLNARIKQLAERYATPLPELEARVDILRAKVAEHLAEMGFSWGA
jgi:type I restriction enzyme M protein